MPGSDQPIFGSADFSTDDVCAVDRLEYWRSQFDTVHEVDVEADLRSRFQGQVRIWRLGPVLVGTFATSARRIGRTQRHLRQDDLDHIVLRVTPAAPMPCGAGPVAMLAQPLVLGIGTYATAYEHHLPEGPWVTAILDRQAFPELWGWHEEPRLLHGAAAALLAGFLANLPGALGSLAAGESASIAQTVRAVIAASLAGCLNPRPAAVDDDRVLLRLKVEKIMAANLSSPRLNPTRIAELAGVSRSTLYRAFEADGGIARFLLARRLSLVRQDLQSPVLSGLTIAEIAERRGLHNAASFHRSFRQHIGETAGEYRASANARHKGNGAGRARSADMRAPSFIDLLRPLAS